jgi:hypothetical protein
VQVVAVEQMRAEGELPGAIGPGWGVAGCANACAVVEQAARGRAPRRARCRGDTDEVVDEGRYDPAAERI